MIGYALAGSNDLDRSKAFFDGVFDLMGGTRVADFPNGGCAWSAGMDKPGFGIGPPYDGNPATVGNGSMVAFVVDARGTVDAVHAKAIELGGKDEGAPGVRGPDGDHAFYGAYFRDPDGNKFCVFNVGGGA